VFGYLHILHAGERGAFSKGAIFAGAWMLCVVATYRESPAGEPRRTRIPRCSATVGPVGPLHPASPALLPRALRGPLRFGATSGREGSLGTPPCGGLEREAEALWSSRRRFTRRAQSCPGERTGRAVPGWVRPLSNRRSASAPWSTPLRTPGPGSFLFPICSPLPRLPSDHLEVGHHHHVLVL
jgi:hypothetical protein